MISRSFSLDAVVTAKSSKTALESASDCVELPLAVVLVEFTYNYSSLDREVLAQVETNKLGICR